MSGMSASLALASGSQTSSSSSLVGPPSGSSTATSLRQALKKRVSKRRTRLGGVMARAMKRSGVQRGLDAVLGKALPVGLGRREGAFAADQQAGFLIGLADGRKRDGAGPRRAGAAGAGGQLGFFLRVQGGGDGNAAVGRIGAAAGKDELAGHEGMAGMAPAHQHQNLVALAVEQDQGRGVARAQRPGR